ncbi:hypothetical protein AAG570_011735 [Ranatra chinensis]|uniref:Peptidoglycan-recognition protein n=1 Tax=Ranatra chinensis TaxID=642074 RepID=A0ABD0YGU6_9HEMI
MPLVRRKQWSAVKPNYPVPPLRSLPARYALIETTGGYQCLNTHRCSQVVLSIQAARVFNGLNDIAYNFLVGGDGLLYEGLGWNKAGYSAGSLNSYAISVAFVGNFTLDLPNPQQINSTKMLLEGAVRANQLAPDYKLMLVSQVAEGDTAGPRLTSLVRSWPHWSECDPVCQQIKKADEQDDF